ncbi:hypothetical protein GQR58_026277 [Nymphon striatum]|nr:hypothetical protein GQR58_026277 [Nymphon striatum]KAG1652437.1 hypothetical protein GQR58_026277 [Nymphon striatum]KAG1652438.1 hypothetical protein GQR58_026277 [Nymphon striatum]
MMLLQFTRAQQDGICSFIWMLSDVCGHTSCITITRIMLDGAVSIWLKLNSSHRKSEFRNGNFVVKQWEKGGRIIGRSKTPSALCRNLRSHIAIETRALFNVCLEDHHTHKESTVGQRKLDNKHEDSVYQTLQRFNAFCMGPQTKYLQNIATKDVATEEIPQSLLDAHKCAKKQLETL